jgi:hypothetical protein
MGINMGFCYGERVIIPQDAELGVSEERGMVLDEADDGLVLIHVDTEYLMNEDDTGLRKVSAFFIKNETIH